MGRVLDRLSAGGRVFCFRLARPKERARGKIYGLNMYIWKSLDLAARAASCPRQLHIEAPPARWGWHARRLRDGARWIDATYEVAIRKTPPARWRRSWETPHLRGGGREYELPARWFVRPLPAGRTGMSPARWHCHGRTTCAVVRLASPARRTGLSRIAVGELPARWFVWPSPARRRGVSPARWHCRGRTTCAVVRSAFACEADPARWRCPIYANDTCGGSFDLWPRGGRECHLRGGTCRYKMCINVYIGPVVLRVA